MANINDVYERDLDLNLLRVFVVVAEEGSVTRAASRLYVTQPAVSAALRRLATFVGAALFARQGRGVALTSRGLALLHTARSHLPPLVAAAMAAPRFDPTTSRATVRLGLADAMESLLLPRLLARLRAGAPAMQLVVTPVQFRTVEEALLSRRVDMAVSVADELPRSILRRPLLAGEHGARGRGRSGAFVCLYDPRVAKLPRVLSERAYFAREHVAVSYAGDARGVVEDALGKTRTVRVAVPAFGYVADVVDGSPLLATVPGFLAEHVVRIRPHLRYCALPFALDAVSLELLWARVTDDDAPARFVRGLLVEIGEAIGSARRPGSTEQGDPVEAAGVHGRRRAATHTRVPRARRRGATSHRA